MTSETFGSSTAEPDERFDRLVDGSLRPGEYRALLAALDDEPGAWRKCALTFLEAQALQQELSPAPAVDCSQSRDGDVQVTRPTSARVPPHWLAMAASFLAALAIVTYAPTFFQHATFFLRSAKEPIPTGNFSLQTIATDDRTIEAGEVLPRRVGDLQLIFDSDEDERFRGQVPVFEIHANLSEILAREEAALDPELIDAFRRSGYEVRHEQQYVPAPLEDGRQVIVPVQGYEIRPVSRTY